MTQTLTIQPCDLNTYLVQNFPNTNYGGFSYLSVQATINNVRRVILKFDFSALPVGATISAATLSLDYWNYAGSNPVGRTHLTCELTQIAWTELGATWNKYDGTNNWGVAGGDFTTTDSASTTIPAGYDWINWNVLALVQHFKTAHGKIAHFLIKDSTEDVTGAQSVTTRSSHYTTDTNRQPKLVINYTVPNIVLTADAGSYSMTGQTAALRAARKLPAGQGSYSLTGQSAVLKAARKLPAEAGSLSLTGQLAALRAARRIAAAPDSYALTGQAADLKRTRRIAAGAGSYALTGQDVVLRAIRKLAAAAGSYALVGEDTNLVIGHHYILVAEPGSYGEPYSKIFLTLDGRIYKKMGNTYLRIG